MTDHITRDRRKTEFPSTPPLRRPDYIRVRAPGGEGYEHIQELMRSKSLHTVCEEAHCPNLGECWGSGTATFLILGDICTRSCGFCDIRHGRPLPLDPMEAERVVQAVKAMRLKHAVITSVNRDELPDGGASVFAAVIRGIHNEVPKCTVEVLIPDFKGDLEALKISHGGQTGSLEPQYRNCSQALPECSTSGSLRVVRNRAAQRTGFLPRYSYQIRIDGRSGRNDG